MKKLTFLLISIVSGMSIGTAQSIIYLDVGPVKPVKSLGLVLKPTTEFKASWIMNYEYNFTGTVHIGYFKGKTLHDTLQTWGYGSNFNNINGKRFYPGTQIYTKFNSIALGIGGVYRLTMNPLRPFIMADFNIQAFIFDLEEHIPGLTGSNYSGDSGGLTGFLGLGVEYETKGSLILRSYLGRNYTILSEVGAAYYTFKIGAGYIFY
ncbi:MAG: hypothetical protein ACI9JN_001776 [Bacteroidia bacterium]